MQEASPPIIDGGDERNIEESGAKEQSVAKKDWKTWLKSEAGTRFLYGGFGLLVILLVFRWLQFSTNAVCCGDYDGYYHIRWSQLLWENFSQGKWLPEFKWLPLTVLSPDTYADHHFLFHLLQIPFLWFFEPVMAAKVGAVFFAAVAVFSCYWLILKYKIEYPVVWLLALLTCANPFYYRMNMAKAPPISIVFTVLGAWLLFERRYLWLLPLTFFFVWAYSLYPMLIVAAGIWTLIVLWNEGKFEWLPVTYTVAGAIAGNLINPYFPNNIKLFVEHFVTKFKAGDYAVAVGGEWYPYDSWVLLGACTVAFVAMFLGYVLFMPNEKRLEEKSTFFLLFATFLMVWTFKSKRFAEYFPPMAILFAAFAWRAFAMRKALTEPALPEDFLRDITPYLDKPVETEKEADRDFWKTACVTLVGVILLVMMFTSLHGIEIPKSLLSEVSIDKRCLKENYFTWQGEETNFLDQGRCVIVKSLSHELEQNEPRQRYEKAFNWALKNIPEGERIFNTDWDDFPKMFYLDQKHVYISGLDPNYLYSRNPELSKLVEEITSGKNDDPGPLIREKFNANWVFSDNNHDDFYAKAMDSGWFEKVYEDKDSFILKIREEKGAAPSEAAEHTDDSGGDDGVEVTTEPENTNQPTENQ